MKRAFDFLGAAAALLLLAPAMLVLALLVRHKLGAPVLFSQRRPGRGGRVFTMWKFRSMTDAKDAAGQVRPDAERLTTFGRWLRSTSLDELPELFNILNGDMSFVGPRPLLVEYLKCYSPEQARRHEVRPGLTGWAQINGRNALSWEEKFRLDVWYVDHRTFFLDFKIIVLTALKVVRRDGIAGAGEATMARFTGTPAHQRKIGADD
jgi:lipopolysaccharide/colanic/teichoic acid biosynthesis glycosyltransferase